jgi:2-desacetyl-2-hydroxyethyl bacteriochlorophyllide A dehydrogenase
MSFLISKVYTLSGPRQLFLKEEEIRLDDLGEAEIVAETIYSAISPGTETAAYLGISPLRPGNIYPRVVGYCNIAKVIACGSSVTNWTEGDYMLSFQSHRTSFKINESDFALKLDPGINLKEVAVTYLFHLGYHAIISANAKAGHNIAVIGVGTLGLATALMIKLIGAIPFALSNQTPPLSLIKQKISIYQKNADCLKDIQGITHGTGIDIVINTSNTWTDWKLALELIRKGGTIVNVGFPGRGQVLPDFNPLDPTYIYFKNIQIKTLSYINETDTSVLDFRFNMKRNLEYLLDKIIDGSINANCILTEEIHYTRLEEQYEKYTTHQHQLYSTLINWKN